MKVGKKPLNNLENPTPTIYRKAGPRFRDAGKHWMVDNGKALYEAAQGPLNNGLIDSVVLIQNRDYNKQFAYGVSSHKTTVNEDFRPPMKDAYLDEQSLSRIPVKIKPIRARINKGSDSIVKDGNNFTGMQQYVDKSYWNGAKHSQHLGIRNNLSIPFDDKLLREGNVLPDLVRKIPAISLSSGFDVSGKGIAEHQTQYANNGEWVLETNMPEYSASAGFNPDYTYSAEDQKSRLELRQIRGTTSGSAGFNSAGLKLDAPDAKQYLQLEHNGPQVSASSGVQLSYTQDGEINRNYEFQEKLLPAQGVVNIQSEYYVDNLDKNTDYVKFKESQPEEKINYSNTPLKPYDFTQNAPQIRLRNDAHSARKPSVEARGFVPKTGVTFAHHKLRDVKVGKQM
jgi:hypothetical protein